jgi:hypothetical protein
LADYTDEDSPNPGDERLSFSAKGQSGRFVRVDRRLAFGNGPTITFFALGELQVLSNTNNVALGVSVTALDSIEAGRWAKRIFGGQLQ